jgi:hypothetical protein
MGDPMERPTVWTIIDPIFTRDEAWGDPDKINGQLLLLMFAIRVIIPWPCNINYGTQGVHTSESQHYIGNADDHYYKTDVLFYDQICRMEEVLDDLQVADRVGLGIYPAWTAPGFHIDVRGHKARWGWTGDLKPDGSKEYCSYEHAKLYALAMKKERCP